LISEGCEISALSLRENRQDDARGPRDNSQQVSDVFGGGGPSLLFLSRGSAGVVNQRHKGLWGLREYNRPLLDRKQHTNGAESDLQHNLPSHTPTEPSLSRGLLVVENMASATQVKREAPPPQITLLSSKTQKTEIRKPEETKSFNLFFTSLISFDFKK
jgi:hypothetical protein